MTMTYGVEAETAASEEDDGHHLITVWGEGMHPLIPHRSLLALIPTTERAVRPGDIIAWKKGNVAVARRVIRVAGEGEVLECMSDRSRKASRIELSQCAGVAAWRSCHGFKRSLVFSGGAAGALYLAIRRLELDRQLRRRKRDGGGLLSPATLITAPIFVTLAFLRRMMEPLIASGRERSPLKQEIPFLLDSLRSAMFPDAGSLCLPTGKIDWDVCLDMALRHGVEGIVGGIWSDLPADQRPPERVLDFLRLRGKTREETWHRSLERLGTVLPALATGGIPALVLKGPVLAWSFYTHPAERPYNDLDILVPRQKRSQALAALSLAGYRVEAGTVGKGLVFRGHFHVVLADRDYTPPVVELHWNLLDRANFFHIDMDMIFRRARTLELPGGPVRTLSQVDEFIYLCLHLCKHGVMNRFTAEGRTGVEWLADGHSGNRLIWFVDLLGALSSMAGSVKAVELGENVRAWNAEEEVALCLQLTRKLFPAADSSLFPGMLPTAKEDEVRERETPFPEGAAKRLSILRWAMRPLPGLVVRPIRLLGLKRLFFPPPQIIRRYYGITEGDFLVPVYLKHFPHMLRRLLEGG